MNWWLIYLALYGFSLLYYFILEPLWYTFTKESVDSYGEALGAAWSDNFWDDDPKSAGITGPAGCFLIFFPFVLVFIRLIKCINIFKLARHIRDKQLEKKYLEEEAKEREEKLLAQLDLHSRKELDDFLKQQKEENVSATTHLAP